MDDSGGQLGRRPAGEGDALDGTEPREVAADDATPTAIMGTRQREDLRLAIAMNGGVSLAIWIGGATYELWRFAQERGPWSGHGGARLDVMAGTSAGGINAALLAAATLWPGGDDDRLAGIRDLWLDVGGLEPVQAGNRGLLRDPSGTRGAQLDSLLDGELFFDELEKAFMKLIDLEPPLSDVEIDLQMPATSLAGGPDNVAGAMGGVFPGRDHAACFHLRHRAGDESDFFDRADPVGSKERLARTLATASRSTASFPFAFAPCDVPTSLGSTERDEWPLDGPRTRRLVDGGVLNNLPIDRAIDAIFEMSASGPVDRYLAVLVPDPPAAAEEAIEDGVADVLSDVVLNSVLTIPRAQSVSDVLRSVGDNNALVDALRASRGDLLETEMEELFAAADALWPSYRSNRRAWSARNIAAAWQTAHVDDPPSYAEVLRCLPEHLPWIPAAWDSDPIDGDRPWGASTIRRMVATLLDLLGRAVDAGATDLGDTRESIHRIRREAAEISSIRDVPHQTAASAAERRRDMASTTLRPTARMDDDEPLRSGLDVALGNWPSGGQRSDHQDPKQRLRELTGELGDHLLTVANAWFAVTNPPEATADTHDQLEAAGQEARPPTLIAAIANRDETANPHGHAPSPQNVLCALEVVQYAFRGLSNVGEQSVKVGLLSPRLRCPIDPRRRTSAEQKLAGDELGHFAAFLKRTWRANDWMWGRLDAATFIGQLLKHREAAERPHTATNDIDACVVEAQRAIVRDEAPTICQAARCDARAGAAIATGILGGTSLDEPAPQTWSDVVEALALESTAQELMTRGDDLDTTTDTPGDRTADAFLSRLQIGEEKISQELRSPMLARVGTTAAATSLRVLKSDSSWFVTMLSRLLAPVAGVTDAAHRYARRIRPRTKPSTGSWLIGVAGITIPAALAFASLFGVDIGIIAPIAWIALIGALLAVFLVAPLTTVILILAAVAGAILVWRQDEPPDWMWSVLTDDTGDVWRYDWLPRAIAWTIIVALLSLVPLRIVGRIDAAWWKLVRRGRSPRSR